MAANFQQVVYAVDQVLARVRCYRESARVRHDVLECIRNYPSLQPREAAMAGQTYNVLQLAGTIPVLYNGVTYNIPVTVWIPAVYPAGPPVPFVTPTSGMVIKPRHRHADTTGMCYLPYLSNWHASHSNLAGAIASMCQVFGQDPPVRAAPPGQVAQAHSAASPSPGSDRWAPTSQGAAGGGPSQAQPFEDPASVARRNALRAVTEKTQKALAAMPTEIDKMMARNAQLEDRYKQLRKQKDQIASARGGTMDPAELERRISEIQKWLEQHDTTAEVSIDLLTEPKDPMSKQLLQLVAEDAAIEDATYFLDKALGKGEIDIEEFLRANRNLCRDQFSKRATIKKIHDRAKRKQ